MSRVPVISALHYTERELAITLQARNVIAGSSDWPFQDWIDVDAPVIEFVADGQPPVSQAIHRLLFVTRMTNRGTLAFLILLVFCSFCRIKPKT